MTMEQVGQVMRHLRPERAASSGAEERRARWLRTSRTPLLATARNLLDEPDRTAEPAGLSGLAVRVLHGEQGGHLGAVPARRHGTPAGRPAHRPGGHRALAARGAPPGDGAGDGGLPGRRTGHGATAVREALPRSPVTPLAGDPAAGQASVGGTVSGRSQGDAKSTSAWPSPWGSSV